MILGWGSVNDIDMKKFYKDTKPRYWVLHCQLQFIDCRMNWKLVVSNVKNCVSSDKDISVYIKWGMFGTPTTRSL